MMDDYRVFDSLMASNTSFALFRMPEATQPTLVMQHNGGHECLHSFAELNGQTGYVFAPFAITPATPLLLLRPDVVVQGEAPAIAHAQAQASLIASQPQGTAPSPVHCPAVTANSFAHYEQAFGTFLQALHSGQYQKLVLSREATHPRPAAFSPGLFFQKACKAYPTAFVMLVFTPTSGAWLASTPEMLLVKQGPQWETVALAGTIAMESSTTPLQWDEKNIHEQALVAQYMRQRLAAYAHTIQENEPCTVIAGALAHLKTAFRFSLPPQSRLGDLLAALHPTPAVCGMPKEDAYQFILQHEQYQRLYYSGFSGWLNPKGRTGLYVTLRCMRIMAEEISLFAGGGLLAASQLHAEWQETEAKLNTLLSLLHTQ